MKKVLFIVGPALGHVGRSLVIARELTIIGQCEVCFACVEPGYGSQIIRQEYPSFISIPSKDKVEILFAIRLEKIIDEVAPDLICFDISPLPWLSLLHLPEIPSAYISNHFLPFSHDMVTAQDEWFAKYGACCNKKRIKRGLRPLTSSKDLYEMDVVLLADPPCITSSWHSFPRNYYIVGPCSWEPAVDLPHELDNAGSILYVSLGSTGMRPLPNRLITDLATSLEIDTIVFAGSPPGSPSRIMAHIKELWFAIKRGNNDNYSAKPKQITAQWLPATKVLRNSSFMVTQGGTGSSYQALMHGVPLGFWPTLANHQILSKVLQDYGVGIRLDLVGNDIAEIVQTRVNSLRSRAIEAANSLSPIYGPRNAADVLIRLLEGRLDQNDVTVL